MKVIKTHLSGVKIIEPDVFNDTRGFFMETYQKKRYRKEGISCDFVQDNFSYSTRGALRGLHYQLNHSQNKLVSVVKGAVFDVAVDIRKGSPNFGRWMGVELSDDNCRQLFIPEGFAHGFYVLSETAYFIYKCSDFYTSDDEYGILWSDPDIGIEWPGKEPVLSSKDNLYSCLDKIPENSLPKYKG